MSEGSRPNANYTSEASRMLEAALEQMDGIIQGAKYELPTYFDNFSIQVGWSLTHMSSVFEQVFILFQESPPQNTSVEAANNINEALKNLKKTTIWGKWKKIISR